VAFDTPARFATSSIVAMLLIPDFSMAESLLQPSRDCSDLSTVKHPPWFRVGKKELYLYLPQLFT